MKAIAELMRRLGRYSDVRYEVEDSIISVLPVDANGFTVSLWDESPKYTVFFDMWHTELDDAEQALACFAFGLSDNCRVKVTHRGGLPHVWSVEAKKAGQGLIEYELEGRYPTGHILFPLWRKAEVKYLQNHYRPDTNVSCN